jgi:hypothetical protein
VVIMKAFLIDHTDKLMLPVSSRIDGRVQHSLPAVMCAVCGKRVYDGGADFAALKVPPSLIGVTDKLDPKAISAEEYQKMRAEVLKYNSAEVELLPGSSFGPFIGKMESRQVKQNFDFLFADGPLILRSTGEKLRQEGIELTLGPATLHHKKHVLTQYATIQADMAPLMSERTQREISLQKCPACGIYRKTDVWAKRPDVWYLLRANWPRGKHLVRSREHSTYIIPSDEFMAVVQRLGLTGIAFEEIGEWV